MAINYTVKDAVQTLIDLPTTGNSVGDIRTVISIGTVKYWNGTAWTNVPSFDTIHRPGNTDCPYTLAEHIAANHPHEQYILRSEILSIGGIGSTLGIHEADPSAHASYLIGKGSVTHSHVSSADKIPDAALVYNLNQQINNVQSGLIPRCEQIESDINSASVNLSNSLMNCSNNLDSKINAVNDSAVAYSSNLNASANILAISMGIQNNSISTLDQKDSATESAINAISNSLVGLGSQIGSNSNDVYNVDNKISAVSTSIMNQLTSVHSSATAYIHSIKDSMFQKINDVENDLAAHTTVFNKATASIDSRFTGVSEYINSSVSQLNTSINYVSSVYSASCTDIDSRINSLSSANSSAHNDITESALAMNNKIGSISVSIEENFPALYNSVASNSGQIEETSGYIQTVSSTINDRIDTVVDSMNSVTKTVNDNKVELQSSIVIVSSECVKHSSEIRADVDKVSSSFQPINQSIVDVSSVLSAAISANNDKIESQIQSHESDVDTIYSSISAEHDSAVVYSSNLSASINEFNNSVNLAFASITSNSQYGDTLSSMITSHAQDADPHTQYVQKVSILYNDGTYSGVDAFMRAIDINTANETLVSAGVVVSFYDAFTKHTNTLFTADPHPIYALRTHNHDTVYASISHTHDQYLTTANLSVDGLASSLPKVVSEINDNYISVANTTELNARTGDTVNTKVYVVDEDKWYNLDSITADVETWVNENPDPTIPETIDNPEFISVADMTALNARVGDAVGTNVKVLDDGTGSSAWYTVESVDELTGDITWTTTSDPGIAETIANPNYKTEANLTAAKNSTDYSIGDYVYITGESKWYKFDSVDDTVYNWSETTDPGIGEYVNIDFNDYVTYANHYIDDSTHLTNQPANAKGTLEVRVVEETEKETYAINTYSDSTGLDNSVRNVLFENGVTKVYNYATSKWYSGSSVDDTITWTEYTPTSSDVAIYNTGVTKSSDMIIKQAYIANDGREFTRTATLVYTVVNTPINSEDLTEGYTSTSTLTYNWTAWKTTNEIFDKSYNSLTVSTLPTIGGVTVIGDKTLADYGIISVSDVNSINMMANINWYDKVLPGGEGFVDKLENMTTPGIYYVQSPDITDMPTNVTSGLLVVTGTSQMLIAGDGTAMGKSYYRNGYTGDWVISALMSDVTAGGGSDFDGKYTSLDSDTLPTLDGTTITGALTSSGLGLATSTDITTATDLCLKLDGSNALAGKLVLSKKTTVASGGKDKQKHTMTVDCSPVGYGVVSFNFTDESETTYTAMLEMTSTASDKIVLKSVADTSYAEKTHTHAISEITSLQDTLDAKVASSSVGGSTLQPETTAIKTEVTYYGKAIGELVYNEETYYPWSHMGFDTVYTKTESPSVGDTVYTNTGTVDAPVMAESVAITEVTGTYSSDILATEAAVNAAVSGKADSTHTHEISDVTDLETTLNGKVETDGSSIMTGDLCLGKHGSGLDFSTFSRISIGAVIDETDPTKSKMAFKYTSMVDEYISYLVPDGSNVLTVTAAGSLYAEKESTEEHIADEDVHVTTEDKAAWNAKISQINGSSTDNPYVVTKITYNGTDYTADSTNSGVISLPTVTGLPDVTADNNGKVLKVINGAWALGDDDNDNTVVTVTDNLTSDSATEALSAKQGKALDAEIDNHIANKAKDGSTLADNVAAQHVSKDEKDAWDAKISQINGSTTDNPYLIKKITFDGTEYSANSTNGGEVSFNSKAIAPAVTALTNTSFTPAHNTIYTRTAANGDTYAFTAPTDGSAVSFRLYISTGDTAYAPTWPSDILWENGTAPSITSATSLYMIVFEWNSVLNKWLANQMWSTVSLS